MNVKFGFQPSCTYSSIKWKTHVVWHSGCAKWVSDFVWKIYIQNKISFCTPFGTDYNMFYRTTYKIMIWFIICTPPDCLVLSLKCIDAFMRDTIYGFLMTIFRARRFSTGFSGKNKKVLRKKVERFLCKKTQKIIPKVTRKASYKYFAEKKNNNK